MRRYVFLLHRWTGIAMCLLMAAWFVSGVVMLFVGYPKLTPTERLSSLPALAAARSYLEPAQALRLAASAGAVEGITLTTIAGRPQYVLQDSGGRLTRIDALASGTLRSVAMTTGPALPRADAATALAAAQMFRPGAGAHYAGLVQEDRCTHGRGLNPHRPLHVVELDDADATRVYVSSATGQVVLDAPRAERYWNFVGAWLHWLYMLRDQPIDPVWSWTVICLSAVGVFSAATGLLNGIWRWRFSGRYKNGARTPYRDAAMRWHHLLGLGFGLVLCTWMFSGLMSMNPLRIFDPAMRPDIQALQGATPAQSRITGPVPSMLRLLAAQSFSARELEWRVLDGEPYVLARNGSKEVRIVTESDGVLQVRKQWPEPRLIAAAARSVAYPVAAVERLERHDAFYYAREQASMYGGYERRLPALRVAFADPGATWIYLDMQTGQVELSLDRMQRAGRWLFNFLHSWDVPALLTPGWPRELVLTVLSIGGLLLSVTASIIGWRRVRKSASQR